MLMWPYVLCVRYFVIILLRDVRLRVDLSRPNLTRLANCVTTLDGDVCRKLNAIWHSLQNIFDLFFKHYGQLARDFIFSGTIFRAMRSRDRLGGDELCCHQNSHENQQACNGDSPLYPKEIQIEASRGNVTETVFLNTVKPLLLDLKSHDTIQTITVMKAKAAYQIKTHIQRNSKMTTSCCMTKPISTWPKQFKT